MTVLGGVLARREYHFTDEDGRESFKKSHATGGLGNLVVFLHAGQASFSLFSRRLLFDG
jgi:hypothetical protein